MPAAQIFQMPSVFEDSGAYLLAKIRGTTGAYISKASLASPGSIQLKVYDADSDDAPPTEVASRTIVVDDTVFDTLQIDSGWDLTADPDGFNFKVEILPADLPAGGKRYRFEFKFTNATGKIWHVAADVPTIGLFRS